MAEFTLVTNGPNLQSCSVSDWNRFRKANQRIRPDLAGCDFSNRKDLSHVDLSYCNLKGANFCKARLDYGNLEGADLTDAVFNNSSIRYTSFDNVMGLVSTSFVGSDMTGAILPAGFTFDALETSAATAKVCNLLFTTFLVGFLYAMIVSATDDFIIVSEGLLKLPFINASVPAKVFFIICPPLVFILSLYYQFYFNHYMQLLSRLPVAFPSGLLLTEATHPWIVSSITKLRPRGGILFEGQKFHKTKFRFYLFIGWLCGPLVLFVVYYNSIIYHDWKIYSWVAFNLAFSAHYVIRFLVHDMRIIEAIETPPQKSDKLGPNKKTKHMLLSWELRFFGKILVHISLNALRFILEVMHVDQKATHIRSKIKNAGWRKFLADMHSTNARTLGVLIFLGLIGFASVTDRIKLSIIDVYADVPFQAFVKKPDGWNAENPKLEDIVSLDMTNRNFNFASMNSVFAPKVDLTNSHFKKADMEKICLTGSTVDDTNFTGSKLDDADLRLIQGTNTNFSEASLRKARVQESKLKNVNLSNGKLHGAKFNDSVIEGANGFSNFGGAQLEDADFSKAIIINASYSKAVCEGTRFSMARLDNVSFEGAVFNHLTNFNGAELTHCSFINLNIEKWSFNKIQSIAYCNFSSAKLYKPDFSSTQIGNHNRFDFAVIIEASGKGVEWIEASLVGSTIKLSRFADSFFDRARFSFATLRNVRFVNCKMGGSLFAEANVQEVDFKGSSLVLSDFSQACINRVSFSGANLTKAKFRNADLVNVDFTTAGSLRNCDFSGANLSSCKLTPEQLSEIIVDEYTVLPSS